MLVVSSAAPTAATVDGNLTPDHRHGAIKFHTQGDDTIQFAIGDQEFLDDAVPGGNDTTTYYGLQFISHMPGQQVVNPLDRMVGDMCQHMAEVRLRIDAIELGTDDQRVHGRGPLAAAVGAEVHEVLRPSATPRSGFSAMLLSISARPPAQ